MSSQSTIEENSMRSIWYSIEEQKCKINLNLNKSVKAKALYYQIKMCQVNLIGNWQNIKCQSIYK